MKQRRLFALHFGADKKGAVTSRSPVGALIVSCRALAVGNVSFGFTDNFRTLDMKLRDTKKKEE